MNISCSQKNPFFEKYNTPHATVPFDKIKNEHYKPAIQEGIKQQTAEVDAITSNPEAPTFENTILAYEKSGDLLSRTLTVFFNLRSAETNDELQVIAQEVMPQLSEHSNNISLNQALFERVKVVYDQKESANLNPEQLVLLDKVYDSFIRSGANLEGAQKEKYRELTQKLSQLGLTYGENNLKETNNYQLVISDESKLAGLPESAIEAAKETATEKGVEGWVFTLDAPSYIPLLRYAEDRDLRKELYLAYNTKCTHDNEYNNLEVVKEIVNTEMAIAQLLGYKSYADFTLEKRMAENSDNVYKLLNDLIEAYKPTALKEVAEVEALAKITQGADFTLMPWDWSFYSEKLKIRNSTLMRNNYAPTSN